MKKHPAAAQITGAAGCCIDDRNDRIYDGKTYTTYPCRLDRTGCALRISGAAPPLPL